MRISRAITLLLLIVFTAGVVLATDNSFGIADKRSLSFDEPTKVGDVLLPAGDYTVRHTMQGDQHIMVFTNQKGAEKGEAKIRCLLKALDKPSQETSYGFVRNPASERVLTFLLFKGDKARHEF